jgi:hypothetical protein
MIVVALFALALIAADIPGPGRPGIYDKHPEPGFGFGNPPEATFGKFQGTQATSGWACLAWFPASICKDSTYVGLHICPVMRQNQLYCASTRLVLRLRKDSTVFYSTKAQSGSKSGSQ